ncbi:hypothetical protein [Streptomyces alboflavus]|uniref:hypothetical protein n=1 Tax=Streptomyces alboflavus TaxID=67267 RepID=UPI0004C20E8E|nr:hypothetical protein [Streptomyces alboflavus]
MTDWTPPPPGDTREQLPTHLLDLITPEPYESTACQTARLLDDAIRQHPGQAAELTMWRDRLYARCRINHKFTGELCTNAHHRHEHAQPTGSAPVQDITITRQRGHGLIVNSAPQHTRMTLTALADHGWGLSMVGTDQINIADQVLYQVVGYDAESACLLLGLVEDWRRPVAVTFDRRLGEDEIKKFEAAWRRRYGSGQAHATRPMVHEEEPET